MISRKPQIRFGHPQDFDAIIDLGAEVFTPFGSYRETIRGWLNTAGVRSLVACRKEVFCGAVIFAFFTEEDHFYTEILALEVAREHRRSGIGRALMESVIDHVCSVSKIYPVLSIRLSTAETNHPALALFLGLGFHPTGEEAGRYDGGQRIVRMAYRVPQDPRARGLRRFLQGTDE